MSAPAPQKASVQSEQMSGGRVISYALGDVANNVAFMMTSLFLMAYLTEIAGISAGVAGTIYGITKIWAGVSDLVAGNTVGRKQTRFGRLRPWVMFGSLPLAIALVGLFSVPAGLSGTAAVVWVFLFDAFFQLAYSFVNIPYGSLSAAMTQDPIDRSRLSGARAIASSLTGVILAIVLSPQFKDTTADGIRLKFTITTIVLALVAITLYYLCFRGTKEVIPPSAERPTLATTFKMVGKNSPLLVLCLAAIFTLTGMFTLMAVQMYYARYVVGGASFFIFMMIASTLGTVLVAGFAPAITRKMGKRNGYLLVALITMVAYAILALAPTGQIKIWALVGFFVYGMGSGGTNAMIFSMQADTVDYGEWKTNVRSEGGAYSILSFSRKVGQGIGGFVAGGILSAFAYVPKAPTQSAEALQGIRLSAGWIPAALSLVAALIIFFYPLKAEKHKEIISELTERRAKRATGALVAGRPLVTLNEQYGAGATYVGTKVAERLGVSYVGTRFSSQDLEAAEMAATARAEQDSNVIRFLHSFARTETDSDRANAEDNALDAELVSQNISEVAAMAAGGGVITGRDATVILGDTEGALHVRLVGPEDFRAQQAAQEFNISREVAAERLAREDRMRTEMSERLMSWDPSDPTRYDLIVDTGKVSLDGAVDQIVAAYRAKYPKK
ncbi:glucuronide carrier protein [Raineyella antarctica]|uniref:Glucuronide carrier protein n=1 Tax=Raineyella antarctica TaxID=1577474 RepID=A0A1G6GGL9_9ACTN|nr:cytidylate kinase family protein [Raineyella antarctica]SDB81151.1 glucuronide carrier protein [Raineyella antarctica]